MTENKEFEKRQIAVDDGNYNEVIQSHYVEAGRDENKESEKRQIDVGDGNYNEFIKVVRDNNHVFFQYDAIYNML